MLEVSLIIALISTVGHFLFMWGAYVERKLTLVSNFIKMVSMQIICNL